MLKKNNSVSRTINLLVCFSEISYSEQLGLQLKHILQFFIFMPPITIWIHRTLNVSVWLLNFTWKVGLWGKMGFQFRTLFFIICKRLCALYPEIKLKIVAKPVLKLWVYKSIFVKVEILHLCLKVMLLSFSVISSHFFKPLSCLHMRIKWVSESWLSHEKWVCVKKVGVQFKNNDRLVQVNDTCLTAAEPNTGLIFIPFSVYHC